MFSVFQARSPAKFDFQCRGLICTDRKLWKLNWNPIRDDLSFFCRSRSVWFRLQLGESTAIRLEKPQLLAGSQGRSDQWPYASIHVGTAACNGLLGDVWSKPVPEPLENLSDHFEPVSASLDHSQPIMHHFLRPLPTHAAI